MSLLAQINKQLSCDDDMSYLQKVVKQLELAREDINECLTKENKHADIN